MCMDHRQACRSSCTCQQLLLMVVAHAWPHTSSRHTYNGVCGTPKPRGNHPPLRRELDVRQADGIKRQRRHMLCGCRSMAPHASRCCPLLLQGWLGRMVQDRAELWVAAAAMSCQFSGGRGRHVGAGRPLVATQSATTQERAAGWLQSTNGQVGGVPRARGPPHAEPTAAEPTCVAAV